MLESAGLKTTEAQASRKDLLTVLLACGIAVAVVQIAGDALAAASYPGYSYLNQAVSELSAIGAPTRTLLVVVGAVYEALVFAFAIGVWRTAGDKRSLRPTAVLLGLFAVNAFVWSFFPMQQRGSEMAATDVGHIVGAAVQVLTIVAFIAFGSGADRKWFRIFSVVMIAAILAAGAIAGSQAGRIAEGLSTPWLGSLERVSFYGPSIWILGLAVVLLKARRMPEASPEAVPQRPTSATLVRG